MSDNPARVRMQIDLPVETWLEAFCFIPRREVSNVISYVGRHFYSIAHVRLHKQGKIMLGELCFTKGRKRQAELYVRRSDQSEAIVPLPEVAMPKNVVSFKKITIKFINGQVMAMLHKIRDLFATVNCLSLESDYDYIQNEIEGSERTFHMLRQICPLLGTVNSLCLAFSNSIPQLDRISPSILARATSMRIKKFSAIHVPAICHWLTADNSGEEDQTHKFLLLGFVIRSDVLATVDQLKKEFLASTRPATNFVGFIAGLSHASTFDDSTLHNPTTSENLYIGKGPSLVPYSIVRYSCGDVPEEGKWAEWLDQRWKQMNESFMSQQENRVVVIRVKKEEGEGECCIM